MKYHHVKVPLKVTPITMAVYAIAVIPLMLMILEITSELPDNKTKMAAYADDFSAAAGSLENLKYWWEVLCQLGPKFGYFPQAIKSWLIVKPQVFVKATSLFQNTKIQITENGKRHLGAVIGTKTYKEEYVAEKIHTWISELTYVKSNSKD